MSSVPPPVIVWFRRDLRLADNPALVAAAQGGRPVLAVYIHDPDAAGQWSEGAASRWWLHHSLTALERDLERAGIRLTLLRGDAQSALISLIEQTGAQEIHWNRRYEPWAIQRDTALKAALTAKGLLVKSHNGSLLFEPWQITTQSGGPFKVFTPFWRACLNGPPPPRPLPIPALTGWHGPISSDDLESWHLLPHTPDWAGGLRNSWSPGEAPARARLDGFVEMNLRSYANGRDLPGLAATSRLSPHLHFGEISPIQAFHAAQDARTDDGNAAKFLAELGWREFSAQLLYHHPDLPERPLRREFEHFPWLSDQDAFHAWCRGRTGFAIVDAGMRELWETGWMHNRVRMIAASFLVKDLMLPWQWGAAWFWDTLVDADLASNSASWQWVAGCGADAAPFFRIFNPILQGKKFDPDGTYIKRWCGDGTVPPILDHGQRRQAALDAFKALPHVI